MGEPGGTGAGSTEAGSTGARPAFYAAGPGPWRDWWTLLHPPYTAWHLSYVVIGACLAPRVDVGLLLLTLAAFFLAVGISAHYRRYPVAWTVQAWEKAGLTDVGTRVMSLGGGLVMWGTRAGG